MSVRIYGAGMAGLLAATMLRRYRPTVREAQAELPDNHGALLRFRTSAVRDATSQPFKAVTVFKAVKSGDRVRPVASLRDANRYSVKVTGEVMTRSILDLTPAQRWIAPENFIDAMARDAILSVNSPLTREIIEANASKEDVLISTIPMPILMQLMGTGAQFKWRPIWSVSVEIVRPAVDVYQTIYYPEDNVAYYRASVTGNHLIIEYPIDPTDTHDDIGSVMIDFGLTPLSAVRYENLGVKRQEYGKLLPLPADVRHEFIVSMTDRYNLYSVGRFATWRQILLDDVVTDVKRVEEWMNLRSAYRRRKEGLPRS